LLFSGCTVPRLLGCGGEETLRVDAGKSCGCVDKSQPAALSAYTRAIAAPQFRDTVALDDSGRPQLIAGRPLIGQISAVGGGEQWLLDSCGGKFASQEALLAQRMEQHKYLTGKKVAVEKNYAFYSWQGQPLSIPTKELKTIHAQGALPFLGDAPMDCGDEKNLYLMSDIVGGKYDALIRQRAKEIRDLGFNLLYCWGGESNGTWYPYGRAELGNTPELFAAAMRHVYDLYQTEGVHNLIWVYTPNVVPGGLGPIESVDQYYPYPGRSGEVDFISMVAPDLYNWGTAKYPWGRGKDLSFDELAYSTFSYLRQRHPDKLFGIGEMGTSSIGVDKAAWLTDAYARVLQPPYEVAMALYFNPQTDDKVSPPRWPYGCGLY